MNIFVGNLSFQTSSTDLLQLFTTYGEVTKADVIKDRDTGRSRGFAFVEMPDDRQAQEAIRSLDKTDLAGRIINVSESRPKPQGSRSYASSGRSRY